jgi:hypothetical protein
MVPSKHRLGMPLNKQRVAVIRKSTQQTSVRAEVIGDLHGYWQTCGDDSMPASPD